MDIVLLMVGKTDKSYVNEGVREYVKKLGHYMKFSLDIVPDLKNAGSLSLLQQNQKEGELLINKIKNDDLVILLDETGQQYNSVEFAQHLQKKFNSNPKRLVFVIGGAYGFSEELYRRADETVSLSKMTFSHQMVRFFFIEQLYRAMTILRGEPYHH